MGEIAVEFSYEKSGVSIEKGDAWVEIIKGLVAGRQKANNVVTGVGGFSGLYRLNDNQYLVACCDGVGTKLEVARLSGVYRGLGQDLVAMNVNDLVTCGARPLFFLDYVACGALETHALSEIVEGILDACDESECALLGGETAEMPGVYPSGGFDLAGFSVGIVDRDKLVDGGQICSGDILIGLSSSGLHSNGFSLVRHVLLDSSSPYLLDEVLDGFDEPLKNILLSPTKLYVQQTMKALECGSIRGMAHITGGGLESNIGRVIPKGLSIHLNYNSWQRPAIFSLLSKAGISEQEMRKVFNLGIGYVMVVSPADCDCLLSVLQQNGEFPVIIGSVQ